MNRPRLLLPIAWMLLIFWSSSRAWPGADEQVLAWLPQVVVDLLPVDKVVHAGIYAVLAGLWTLALGPRWALCWLLATGFGAVDEVHQGFVPGRSRDVLDLLADGVGAAAMLVVLWPVRKRA